MSRTKDGNRADGAHGGKRAGGKRPRRTKRGPDKPGGRSTDPRAPRAKTGRSQPTSSSSSASSSSTRLNVSDLSSALVFELERRLRRHPSGDLVGMRRESVPLVLELPVTAGTERLRTARESLESALRSAVDGLVAGRSAESGAQAYCLRCSSFVCGHGTPEPRQVCVGFATNGTPRFEEYSQALLTRGDEGMEDLYGPAGKLVTRLWTEDELLADVLPSFVPGRTQQAPSTDSESQPEGAAPSQSVRLLAQVTAGWYWVPQLEDPSAPRNFAVSFQVLAIEPLHRRSRDASRRLVLSAVGTSPLGGPLEDLHDELGELPWGEASRWLRAALSDVEVQDRRAAGGRGRDAASDAPWEERVLRIVAGFERRLTRRERAERRRTKHAEDRRKQKRPTGHALADLDRADDDRVLRDTQRSTFVVLGDRGRTHIFNPQGRLVTSIQYTPEAIDRRRRSGRWQDAEREHVQALRAAVAEASG